MPGRASKSATGANEMPRLSRWYIRLAFVYLLLGFTVGGLLLAHKDIPIHPALWGWLPAHIEFLLMGWIAQLMMGTAFWIAPRFQEPPRRGNETGAQVAIVLINLGIWLVAAGSLLNEPRWLAFVGRLLEVGAAVSFALHLKQRIVGRDFQPD